MENGGTKTRCVIWRVLILRSLGDVTSYKGRAMAQAVSRPPFTAEARF
jgi:hypothetical protein